MTYSARVCGSDHGDPRTYGPADVGVLNAEVVHATRPRHEGKGPCRPLLDGDPAGSGSSVSEITERTAVIARIAIWTDDRSSDPAYSANPACSDCPPSRA